MTARDIAREYQMEERTVRSYLSNKKMNPLKIREKKRLMIN
jgi:DNA-binding NarL/FixJ family response regulator